MRSVHPGRAGLIPHLRGRGVRVGAHRALGAYGLYGDGPVRGLHCVRAPAEPEGLNPAPLRAPALRRLLGLLLPGLHAHFLIFSEP